MPRTIDREQRRLHLAEAVWRLLERGGLEEASVRGVAAEAGLSTGSVRHFFGTQSELHLFAMSSLTERVAERIRAAEGEPDLRARALQMIGELMPLRDQTRRELVIWWEFVHRSRHDPALAAVVGEQAQAVRALLRHIVDGLIELGLLPDDRDIEQRVRALNALVDGLTFELLTVPASIDSTQARDVLEQYLFGAPSPPAEPVH